MIGAVGLSRVVASLRCAERRRRSSEIWRAWRRFGLLVVLSVKPGCNLSDIFDRDSLHCEELPAFPRGIFESILGTAWIDLLRSALGEGPSRVNASWQGLDCKGDDVMTLPECRIRRSLFGTDAPSHHTSLLRNDCVTWSVQEEADVEAT